MKTRYLVVVPGALAAILALTPSRPTAAADPAVNCQAAKLKEVSKYGLCRLRAEAKRVKKGLAEADSSKCDLKLDATWERLEQAGAGACPTNGDKVAVKTAIVKYSDAVADKLSSVRFVDTGNTVIDNKTGLEWEKKTTFNVDFSYTWSATFGESAADGTAFTSHLGNVNSPCEADNYDEPVVGGLGGYCDWRLPTIEELRTILLEPYPCSTAPCIASVFGPTASSGYWSMTTVEGVPNIAALIDFSDGTLGNSFKSIDIFYVRAVRTRVETLGEGLMRATAAVGTPGGGAAKCESSKLNETSKYWGCRLKAESVKTARGLLAADVAKCDAKLTDKWRVVETQGGADCPTSGDETLIKTFTIKYSDALAGKLSATRFADTGTTIIDHDTGLEWEKQTLANVDTPYTWSVSGVPPYPPDGTAFTVHLSGMNDCTTADGATGSGGFSGHCDWRMPTFSELWGIFTAGSIQQICYTPCIDPIFGPTSLTLGYWSRISFGWQAYILTFGEATGGWPWAGSVDKTYDNTVRAVRTR